jgi:hypothetical protein
LGFFVTPDDWIIDRRKGVSGPRRAGHAFSCSRFKAPVGLFAARDEQIQEFVRRHGLCEKETLRRVETELRQAAQIILCFDSFGTSRDAEPTREIDNSLAETALERIRCATSHETPI